MDTLLGANSADDKTGAQAPGELIKDSDTAHFSRDVIEASMATPVIVDFWAPWCGPCKQLGPAIEKAVRDARGAVRLVKIDVDQNQALAGQLRIQSIPAVYAFFQGQPIDGFVGAQGESQIKAFVERLVKTAGSQPASSPLDEALEQAKAALEAKQFAAASALFAQVLQHEAQNEEALAGLIRCHLASDDIVGARGLFDSASEELRSKPALASVRAALELAEAGSQAGPISDLRARVAANPGDHQARFDLAVALQAAGEREAAVDELIEIVRRERAWNDEAARKQLVKLFEAWGPTDPLTLDARRRLSTLLFA